MRVHVQGIAQLGSRLIFIALYLVLLLGSPDAAHAQANASSSPDSFEALAQSAASAREANHPEEAILDYRRALAMRPDWAEGWWYIGSLQYAGDHYTQGIESFQKLTTVAPQFGPGWTLLGLCEFETKDYASALDHVEKGRALGSGDDPEIARVSAYHLALLLIRHGDFDRASQILASTFGGGSITPQVKVALGLALLRVPLLPSEVDPSHDALIQAGGEAAAFKAQGDSAKALAALQALVKAYPDVASAHQALAQALQENGDAAQATEERRIAETLAAQKPSATASDKQGFGRTTASEGAEERRGGSTSEWNRAMSDYSAGKYSQAIGELNAYVKDEPANGTAWAVLGLSEFELKDYDNALIHLQRGNDLGFGGSAEAVRFAKYQLAVLLNRTGEFKRATDLLAPETGSGAVTNELQFAMGMSLLRMQLLPEQVETSKRALVLSAGTIAGLLYESKYDEAFARFQQLLKQYPNTPFLHYTYGVALASLSQYEEAEVQMREELKLSPDSDLPYLRLASLALRQRRPAEALAPAQRAIKLAPESGEGHYLLGRAYLELGHEADAVRELETASKLAPNSPEVHFNLAKAYAKSNFPEKAEQERAVFTRLNTVAEQQRGLRGNQSYAGPRDSADASMSTKPTTQAVPQSH